MPGTRDWENSQNKSFPFIFISYHHHATMPTTKQNTDKIQSIDGRIHDFELAIDQLHRLEKEQRVCPYNFQHNINIVCLQTNHFHWCLAHGQHMSKVSTMCAKVHAPGGTDKYGWCRKFTYAPDCSIIEDHQTQLSRKLAALAERQEVEATSPEDGTSSVLRTCLQ
ncbi:hypothetical protein N7G274_002997 [Stereocaulon virgatum]|uniref:Uncharacterized protein n=1 Tax=Stereocaulon virgatum TaxID=373712 RepID=A0ABR4AEP1_9LECA